MFRIKFHVSRHWEIGSEIHIFSNMLIIEAHGILSVISLKYRQLEDAGEQMMISLTNEINSFNLGSWLLYVQ